MDRATAIDLLDNLIGMIEDNHESDYDTAIKMGIDALKSNAPNALSALDCIERQATIDALCDNCDTVDPVCAHYPCKRYLSIENLPSVQTDMSGNMSGTHKSLDCISRQAAIEAVLDRCPSDYDSEYECGYYDALKEAVPMLIHVPSVQPVVKDINVPCTDTISRRAAIDAVCEYCEYFKNEDVIQSIKGIPSVQPQRMKGKWETIEGWDGDEVYRCSVCGEEYVLIDGTPKDNGYHFCPNCGADMRRGQDGIT